jgi:hypothetical protein
MLKQVTTTEATVLLIAGAIIGGILVVTQAPVWAAFVVVAIAGVVWGILLARRSRGDGHLREHDPTPDSPRPEHAPRDLARVGSHR